MKMKGQKNGRLKNWNSGTNEHCLITIAPSLKTHSSHYKPVNLLGR